MLDALKLDWHAYMFADDSLMKDKKFRRIVKSILDSRKEAQSATDGQNDKIIELEKFRNYPQPADSANQYK
jgi:hypothetical protein